MTNFDIELGQGDSEIIGVILKENNVPVNLSGYQISFVMANEEDDPFTIPCVDHPTVLANAGGTGIPFTSIHTTNADLFFGKLYAVDVLGRQVTYPSGNDYLSVKIWGKVR